jgi:hypothetical protein
LFGNKARGNITEIQESKEKKTLVIGKAEQLISHTSWII